MGEPEPRPIIWRLKAEVDFQEFSIGIDRLYPLWRSILTTQTSRTHTSSQ